MVACAEVRRSAIHGHGLFATRRIKQLETIGYWEGDPTDDDGTHVLWLDDDSGLDVTNDLRFMNHSPDPNAHFDGTTLEVWAARPISPGEEITIHYGDDWA